MEDINIIDFKFLNKTLATNINYKENYKDSNLYISNIIQKIHFDYVSLKDPTYQDLKYILRKNEGLKKIINTSLILNQKNNNIKIKYNILINYPFSKPIYFTVECSNFKKLLWYIINGYHLAYVIDEIDGKYEQYAHWITDLVLHTVEIKQVQIKDGPIENWVTLGIDS